MLLLLPSPGINFSGGLWKKYLSIYHKSEVQELPVRGIKISLFIGQREVEVQEMPVRGIKVIIHWSEGGWSSSNAS